MELKSEIRECLGPIGLNLKTLHKMKKLDNLVCEVSPNLVPRSSTVIRKEDLVKFDFEHAQCQRGPKYGLFYHCACSYSLL